MKNTINIFILIKNENSTQAARQDSTTQEGIFTEEAPSAHEANLTQTKGEIENVHGTRY